MESDLYETVGSLKWITDIILEYNKLGFYTVTSQPGCIRGNRHQRAYIRGYMDISMGDYIVKHIHNPNLVVRSENHNTIVDSSLCNCSSIIFIDGKPGANNFDTAEHLEPSFNMGLPLRRPYAWAIKNKVNYPFLPTHLTNMSEFDILDLRWDYNDDLWTILLQTIKNYFLNR